MGNKVSTEEIKIKKLEITIKELQLAIKHHEETIKQLKYKKEPNIIDTIQHYEYLKNTKHITDIQKIVEIMNTTDWDNMNYNNNILTVTKGVAVLEPYPCDVVAYPTAPLLPNNVFETTIMLSNL
jgi:hypothetical protein